MTTRLDGIFFSYKNRSIKQVYNLWIYKERKEKKYTYHGGMDSAIINHGRMDSF